MGITDPSEEYFKGGLWGYVSTAWKKLVATAGGALHIQIAGQEADVEIKQQAAADLTPGIMGWLDEAWQKLPMLWGFSDNWCENLTGIASGAGHAIITGQTIPSDEVWVLEHFCIWHTAGAAKNIEVLAYNNGTYATVYKDTAATENVRYFWTNRLTMPPGGNLYVKCSAPGDTKTVRFQPWGYKMLVGE